MPRRNSCQHPTRHIKAACAPVGHSRISLRLSKFMNDQYDLEDTKTCVLCAKCHTFETKKMKKDESMEIEANYSSTDEEEKEEYVDSSETGDGDSDDPTDGAAADHFKNNTSMLNLAYHKADFGLDASWTFSASGHGRDPDDGIGALLKSIARRATLSKSILLASPKNFYEFSKKHQIETAMAAGKVDPFVHIYYLEATEIDRTKTRVLQVRFAKLTSTRTIKGIREVHVFEALHNETIGFRPISTYSQLKNFSFE